MSLFYYIRHGQASYGKPDYDQLSELGYSQSEILGDYFREKKIEVDHIYVGPLRRQKQTYESFREAYEQNGPKLPLPSFVAELAEHRGPEILKMAMNQLLETDEMIRNWDRLGKADPSQKTKYGLLIFDRAMEMWASGDLHNYQPEQYYTWETFRSVVGDFFVKIYDQHRNVRGENVLMFTSGGTISATVGKILGIEDDVRVIQMNGIVQNTSITEIVFNENKYTLKSFNRVPHLSTDMLTYV